MPQIKTGQKVVSELEYEQNVELNGLKVHQTFELQTKEHLDSWPFRIVALVSLAAFIYYPQVWFRQHWNSTMDLFGGEVWAKWLIPGLFGFVFFIIGNLVYAVIYWGNWQFFEQFKDNNLPWPWENDPNFKNLLWKAIKLITLNNLVFGMATSYIMVYVTKALCYKTMQEDIPGFWSYLFQMTFMLFMEDLTFYWGHRTLHHPKLYPHFHKIHHEFYNTISISSEYAHPVEFIIGNLGPVTAGSILLGSHTHIVVFIHFMCYRLIETLESHGGYEFPWAITRFVPLSCTSMYHNWHHFKNLGCYSSQFICWDSIFGTNQDYFKFIHKASKSGGKVRMHVLEDKAYDKYLQESKQLAGLKEKRE